MLTSDQFLCLLDARHYSTAGNKCWHYLKTCYGQHTELVKGLTSVWHGLRLANNRYITINNCTSICHAYQWKRTRLSMPKCAHPPRFNSSAWIHRCNNRQTVQCQNSSKRIYLKLPPPCVHKFLWHNWTTSNRTNPTITSLWWFWEGPRCSKSTRTSLSHEQWRCWRSNDPPPPAVPLVLNFKSKFQQPQDICA